MAINTTWFGLRSRKQDTTRVRSGFLSTKGLSKTTSDIYESTNTDAGEGTFARVKIVKRRRDGAVFAMKIFKLGLTDPRKILAEFYVAHGMRHKNVIATYELLPFEGSQGMLMEYAPECLLDLVTSSALKPGDAEIYLDQLVAGTAHIHTIGFAHRDLKLENVVIGTDGQAKIIDFGTVGTAKPTQPTNTGTLQYMPPELFGSSEYDARLADIWSLGIIYTCMVLGRFPWAVADVRNAAFAAYVEGDRHHTCSSNKMSTEEPDHPWPYPVSVFLPEMRPAVHGMLRVEPSRRASLSMIVEVTSKYNDLRRDSWRSSSETLT